MLLIRKPDFSTVSHKPDDKRDFIVCKIINSQLVQPSFFIKYAPFFPRSELHQYSIDNIVNIVEFNLKGTLALQSVLSERLNPGGILKLLIYRLYAFYAVKIESKYAVISARLEIALKSVVAFGKLNNKWLKLTFFDLSEIRL